MDAPNVLGEPNSDAQQEAPPLPASEALVCLSNLSRRYVWWKSPDQAMRFPDRVAVQVMDLGTFEDITSLIETAGEEYLRAVLQRAEAGQLSPRSWHYWHYRLGLAEYGRRPVPPMPVRKTA